MEGDGQHRGERAFSDGLAKFKLSLLPARLCDLNFFSLPELVPCASVMSQSRQSLERHIRAACGKHFQLCSQKRDHSACVNITTA